MAAQQIYFGRAGLPTASGGDGLALYRADWESEGDEATVDLVVRDMTAADAKALRDQLLGYDLNTDEPVIPIVDNADTSRSGFYRVQRVRQSAESTEGEGSRTKLSYRLTAELLRVPGWQAPIFEARVLGALRANDHSATTVRGWVGLNPKADLLHGYVAPPFFTGIGEIASVGSTATNLLLYDNDASPDTTPDGTVRFSVAPEDYYQNAAKLEVSYDSGTTWRTVTGRQTINLPTQFRLSNDLIRFQHSSANIFTFSGYLSGWETKTFQFTYGGASATSLGAPAAITVLRNTPDVCIIRVWLAGVITNGQTAYLDLKVTRSAWWLEGTLATTNASTATLGVFRGTAEASTSVTYGITATAADANGNKFQIRSPKTVTKDNTNGGIHHAGTTLLPFALGYDTMENATLTTTVAYGTAMNQTQRIVAR